MPRVPLEECLRRVDSHNQHEAASLPAHVHCTRFIMSARRMLELTIVMSIACGGTAGEDVGTASAALDVTRPARDIGIDDAIFRRVDSDSVPVLVCPPDSPFVCRAENAAGWTCSELSCVPTCERIGCPGGLECVDRGWGAECARAGE